MNAFITFTFVLCFDNQFEQKVLIFFAVYRNSIPILRRLSRVMRVSHL